MSIITDDLPTSAARVGFLATMSSDSGDNMSVNQSDIFKVA